MILDTDFPPDSRVENEALSLIEAGHEVFLFSLTYKGRIEEENIRGIRVCRYPANNLTYKLSALAYTFPFYHSRVKRNLKQFLTQNDIQIIHIHDMLIARSVFKVNHQNLPVILDLHENRPAIMRLYRHVNTLQGRLLISPDTWSKYQDKYIEEAYKVIVVTDHAKREIVQKGLKEGDEVVVVPNTIHPDIFYSYPIDNNIVSELSDISGGDLIQERLYNPEIYEFDAPVTPLMINELNIDPHRFVQFTFKNVIYQGFLQSLQPSDYKRLSKWVLVGKRVELIGNNFIFEQGDNVITENTNNLTFED